MRFYGVIGALVSFLIAASAGADQVKTVDIFCSDIAYDPVSQRIYASVSAGPKEQMNSLVVIDPFNARIESSVFIGNHPGQVAVSDKGKYVWVALDGANIRRYDIAEKKAGPLFFMGENLSAEEIHPVPGNPEALLIVRAVGGISPRFGGMVILENGVARAAGGYGNTFAWGAYANRAYSYNNETTGFDFLVMTLTPQGLEGVSSSGGLISGFGRRIRSENGLVFVDGSQVIEPETRTTLGTFDPSSGVYAPDSSVGRMYFAFGEQEQVRLVANDLATFAQIDSITVPGIKGGPTRLVRWGNDGLAFSTSGGQLVLVRTRLVPPKAQLVDLSVKRQLPALPLKVGQPVIYTLAVSNVSTARATQVFLTDRLPGYVDVMDVKSSQGSITAVDGVVRATIGDLLPQQTVTIRVQIQPRQDVTEPFNPVAIARALQRDKNPDNNTNLVPVRTLFIQPSSTTRQPITDLNATPAKNLSGTAMQKAPDLTGTWKPVEQETEGAGVDLQATLNGVFVVRNAGSKPAPECKVHFFLTNTSTLEEELLQAIALPALAPGKTATVRLTARLKKGQSALGQVVTAVIDPASKVKDANRENNLVRSKPIP